jgi:dihydroorotate dehydrogenase (fumarate)
MGLRLRSPLVVGASSLTDDLDPLCRCVDAGAGAVVMRSLFEEEIRHELGENPDTDAVFRQGVTPYLARLQRLRRALSVPVIASLNGTSLGGWVRLAQSIEDAGAEAIELNLYEPSSGPEEPSSVVEDRLVEVVESVAGAVRIPVAVKVAPGFAALTPLARRFEGAGARGLVLFNRWYQPDLDLDTFELTRELRLSTSDELPLRLHALGALHGRLSLDLACSGGVHTGDDAFKALLVGARVVQCVSALLRRGPGAVAEILASLRARMEGRGFSSVDQARGALSLARAPDPRAWERLHYARILKRPPPARS